MSTLVKTIIQVLYIVICIAIVGIGAAGFRDENIIRLAFYPHKSKSF